MKIEDGMTAEQRTAHASLEQQAHRIAAELDKMVNPNMLHPWDTEHRSVGFAVLLFAFGEQQPATWISNADRGDMIRAVEEWLERARARA